MSIQQSLDAITADASTANQTTDDTTGIIDARMSRDAEVWHAGEEITIDRTDGRDVPAGDDDGIIHAGDDGEVLTRHTRVLTDGGDDIIVATDDAVVF